MTLLNYTSNVKNSLRNVGGFTLIHQKLISMEQERQTKASYKKSLEQEQQMSKTEDRF